MIFTYMFIFNSIFADSLLKTNIYRADIVLVYKTRVTQAIDVKKIINISPPLSTLY